MLTICFKSVVPELLFLQQTKENLKVINGGNQTKHNYPRQFTKCIFFLMKCCYSDIVISKLYLVTSV